MKNGERKTQIGPSKDTGEHTHMHYMYVCMSVCYVCLLSSYDFNTSAAAPT